MQTETITLSSTHAWIWINLLTMFADVVRRNEWGNFCVIFIKHHYQPFPPLLCAITISDCIDLQQLNNSYRQYRKARSTPFPKMLMAMISVNGCSLVMPRIFAVSSKRNLLQWKNKKELRVAIKSRIYMISKVFA